MKKLFVPLVCMVLMVFGVATAVMADEQAAKLDEVVVSATKIDTPLTSIPASVHVLTNQDLGMQNLPHGDFMDALRYQTGISLTRAHGPFPATARIRGIGNTVYLINGIPVDWKMNQAIPAEMIERVEIFRGPFASMFGSDATGGAINIITKTGAKDTSLTLKGGGGTFSTYRTGLFAEGSGQNSGFALAGWAAGSDGANVVTNKVNPNIHMINNCSYDKHGFSFSGRHAFDWNGTVSLFYNHFKDDYLRGRVYVGGEWQRDFFSAIYEQGLGDTFSFATRVGYHVDDLLHKYDRGGTRYYEASHRRFTDYKAVPVEAQLTGRFLGGRRNVTVGYYRNTIFEESIDRNWEAPHDERGRLRSSQRFQALYAKSNLEIVSGLILDAGLRYDHWENFDNFFFNYVNTHPPDRSENHISPSIGLRYNLRRGPGIWANYSQGFLPPSPGQLYDDRPTSGGTPRVPNPNLQPETTHSYELGAEHWFHNRLRGRLVGFYTYTDDRILSSIEIDNIIINRNLGKTESKGLEVDVEFFMTNHFSILANYTWMESTIKENPTDISLEGNRVPYAPEHRANLMLRYHKPDDLSAMVAMRYIDDQFTNESNAVQNAAGEDIYMASSVVFDLKVTKTLLKNRGFLDQMDVSLAVDNIFNEKYRTFLVYEDPGTAIFGEISLRF